MQCSVFEIERERYFNVAECCACCRSTDSEFATHATVCGLHTHTHSPIQCITYLTVQCTLCTVCTVFYNYFFAVVLCSERVQLCTFLNTTQQQKKKHTSTSTSILKVYTEMHQGVRHLKNHRQTFYDGQLFSLALLYENATNELATKQHTQANEYVHRLVR